MREQYRSVILAQTGDQDPIDLLDMYERSNDKRRRKWKWVDGVQRTRTGRPGSRRYQQWLNESFLTDTSQLELDDFNVVHQPRITPFHELFEEKAKLEKWQQFLDSSEEEQDELLISVSLTVKKDMKLSEECGDVIDSETAKQSFQKIDKKIRKMLQTHFDSEFVCNLDKEIVNWIRIADYNTLTYAFDDSFHRMICHGVAQFYRLKSRSKDTPSKRVLLIDKPKSLGCPSTTLVQYLQCKPM